MKTCHQFDEFGVDFRVNSLPVQGLQAVGQYQN